jgi:hypothetical protein
VHLSSTIITSSTTRQARLPGPVRGSAGSVALSRQARTRAVVSEIWTTGLHATGQPSRAGGGSAHDRIRILAGPDRATASATIERWSPADWGAHPARVLLLPERRRADERKGDRALVPRTIRSVATPHGWIVAESLARRRPHRRTNAIVRVKGLASLTLRPHTLLREGWRDSREVADLEAVAAVWATFSITEPAEQLLSYSPRLRPRPVR